MCFPSPCTRHEASLSPTSFVFSRTHVVVEVVVVDVSVVVVVVTAGSSSSSSWCSSLVVVSFVYVQWI